MITSCLASFVVLLNPRTRLAHDCRRNTACCQRRRSGRAPGSGALADGATRAAYNFQIAGDGQRAIMQRPNGNWAVAGFKRRYITGRRLARRHEIGDVMGAVAKWFVL